MLLLTGPQLPEGLLIYPAGEDAPHEGASWVRSSWGQICSLDESSDTPAYSALLNAG
jgi:hypothetical protein